MFVRAIDAAANTVTLSENVQFHEMSVSNINWMAYTPNQVPTGLSVKIRYSHNPSLCEIKIIDDNTIHCIFDEPQRAVTPGQAAVFYEGSSIVCGGIIEK
jgi:tRNA-specific 2-thiouridylase